jgi:hypothetical protein
LGKRLSLFLPGRVVVRRACPSAVYPRLLQFIRLKVPMRTTLSPPPSIRRKIGIITGLVRRFIAMQPKDASSNCLDAAVELLRTAGLWKSTSPSVSSIHDLIHCDISEHMGVCPPEHIIITPSLEKSWRNKRVNSHGKSQVLTKQETPLV